MEVAMVRITDAGRRALSGLVLPWRGSIETERYDGTRGMPVLSLRPSFEGSTCIS